MEQEIDLVVTWVDGNDPAWRKQRETYESNQTKNNSPRFYRDWGLMRYWFRGVEKNIPWIHKIYFLTWGHVPAWLNTKHSKLCVVRHEEFIPAEYLPTFSSHTIEWNMHRIKGLSEEFIYANDDFYFIGPIDKEYFFKNGLPCDMLRLRPITEIGADGFGHILWNNIACVNRHFSLQDSMSKHADKWFHQSYPLKVLNMNRIGFSLHNFPGFKDEHLPISYLKSSFEEIWEEEEQLLRLTCNHKFRSIEDISHWLVRYWQLVQGNFNPRIPKGIFSSVNQPLEILRDTILNSHNLVICINDGMDEIDFEERSMYLHNLFEIILPEMSSFELY